MSVRELKHPVTGQTFRLGRKPRDTSKPLPPRLKLCKRGAATSPPATCDYSTAAAAALANIYENDSLGDCAIAGMMHIVGVLTGGAGDEFVATDAQVTSAYKTLCGYVPGNPGTDNGCDLQSVLQGWQQNGAVPPDHKIAGYVSVDPTNETECMTAVYELENLYLGLDLPEEYVSPMPSTSGFVWDVAGHPVPSNGHCIMVYGYNAQGLLVGTWGMTGTMTWAAAAKYLASSAGGECYVVVSQDAISAGTGDSESGIDWSAMLADFQAIGGVQPVPIPAPSPAPQPAPVAPDATVRALEAIYAREVSAHGPSIIPYLVAYTNSLRWVSASDKAALAAYLQTLSAKGGDPVSSALKAQVSVGGIQAFLQGLVASVQSDLASITPAEIQNVEAILQAFAALNPSLAPFVTEAIALLNALPVAQSHKVGAFVPGGFHPWPHPFPYYPPVVPTPVPYPGYPGYYPGGYPYASHHVGAPFHPFPGGFHPGGFFPGGVPGALIGGLINGLIGGYPYSPYPYTPGIVPQYVPVPVPTPAQVIPVPTPVVPAPGPGAAPAA